MPFTTETIAKAAEEWCVEVNSVLSSYEHPPRMLTEALPLVVGEVTRDRTELDKDASMPNLGGYQQQLLRLWTVELMILVDPNPDTWNASKLLYQFVDNLGNALRRDPTLGNRVPSASPLYDASYDPPEVEYADGTVARQVTVTIIIGEPVGVN